MGEMGERRGRGERNSTPPLAMVGGARMGVRGGEKGSPGSYGERGSVEDTLDRRLSKKHVQGQLTLFKEESVSI